MTKEVILVDVSEHNGIMNWELAKPKIHGAILRCSIGLLKDKQFDRNYAETIRLGIPIGIYHAYSPYQDPQAQANNWYTQIKNCVYKIGTFIDVETIYNLHTPTEYLNRVRNTMDTLEGAVGHSAGIYTAAWCWNPSVAKSTWAGTKLLWVACWGYDVPILPRDWTKYKLHQYLADGDGLGTEYGSPISKDMDMSTYNGSLTEFNLYFGLNCQPINPPSKKYAICIANTLNIRENAGANYKIVSYLYKNDIPQILQERIVGNDIWLNIGWKQWVAYKHQGNQYMVYV